MIDLILNIKFLSVVLLFTVFGLLYLLLTITSYKSELDEKNFRLMQLYLDMKFLYKLILEDVNTSNGINFCRTLIREVIEYYNLEDIVIIDSMKSPHNSTNTPLRARLVEGMSQNLQGIENSLKTVNLMRLSINIEGKIYMLYIAPISPDRINDGFIVCVERTPTLLTDPELCGLENCLNLLKTRLIYD